MKLSQNYKTKRTRILYFKAPIKIQHIHSSPKLPIMVSTCWRDVRGGGRRERGTAVEKGE